MGAHIFNAASLQKYGLVQIFHSRDAVSDQQGGLTPPGWSQVFQDHLLGAGIHRRHRVIQDQDGRILQQSAGNGDALLLSAGNGNAALTQHGLKAILEIHDIIPHICQSCGTVELFRSGIVHAKADVVGNGIREQEVILWHIGAGRAYRPDGNTVYILPIHKQGAVRHIVGAQQKVHQGCLASTGLAHDAHALPRFES